MPKAFTVTATYVDTCYIDYLTDHTGILIGVERAGQDRDALIDALADEAYSCEGWPEDAVGDHVYEMLKEAIGAILKTDMPRLWPVDDSGNEITDEDAEVPDEQPSLWVRVKVESEPLKISLRNTDDDDGSVIVDCEDGAAAADDQCIDGSTWEGLEDGSAYTLLSDRPTLVADLKAEGYDVDASEYSEPDTEDMAYWHAKYERSNNASPEALRAILGWKRPIDVCKNRRVMDHQWRMPVAADFALYQDACWTAGFPLDEYDYPAMMPPRARGAWVTGDGSIPSSRTDG